MSSFAEENAIEDTLYHLGEGLRDRKIDLDTYLKVNFSSFLMQIENFSFYLKHFQQVRRLSRQQFMLRAIMIKCRRKAGLDP